MKRAGPVDGAENTTLAQVLIASHANLYRVYADSRDLCTKDSAHKRTGPYYIIGRFEHDKWNSYLKSPKTITIFNCLGNSFIHLLRYKF